VASFSYQVTPVGPTPAAMDHSREGQPEQAAPTVRVTTTRFSRGVWAPEGGHSGEPHKYVSGEEFEAAAAAAMQKALDERSNGGRGRR
jgi:hypothetical protein